MVRFLCLCLPRRAAVSSVGLTQRLDVVLAGVLAAMLLLIGAGRAGATICCNPSTAACTVLTGASCPAGTVAVVGTACAAGACTPQWSVGAFSPCSAICGPGMQTRSVICTIGTTLVSDTVCLTAVGPRPPSSQPCDAGPCAAWVVGGWSACSAACGPGMQTRSVVCMVGTAIVPDSQCASAGLRPPTTQGCDLGPCTGACCLGSTCGVATPASCAAASGRYAGDLLACNAPGNALTPCCLANFDGVNGLQVADIFAFLSAWFMGSPAADFTGSSGVNVQDIFAFLAAWFAGCP